MDPIKALSHPIPLIPSLKEGVGIVGKQMGSPTITTNSKNGNRGKEGAIALTKEQHVKNNEFNVIVETGFAFPAGAFAGRPIREADSDYLRSFVNNFRRRFPRTARAIRKEIERRESGLDLV